MEEESVDKNYTTRIYDSTNFSLESERKLTIYLRNPWVLAGIESETQR